MLGQDRYYDLSVESPYANPLDHATPIHLHCIWYKTELGVVRLSQAVSLCHAGCWCCESHVAHGQNIWGVEPGHALINLTCLTARRPQARTKGVRGHGRLMIGEQVSMIRHLLFCLYVPLDPLNLTRCNILI